MKVKEISVDSLGCLQVTNGLVSLIIAPDLGGRVVSLAVSGRELLWHNPALKLAKMAPEAAYDPNFFGGIDELLPNDEAEEIGDVRLPDHGELWTSGLEREITGDSLTLFGLLKKTGFEYVRTISFGERSGQIHFDYQIKNCRRTDNAFLWKMHAALKLAPGATLVCPARGGEIADEDFTGRRGQRFFNWPHWQGERLDLVPAADSGRCEFFYLRDLSAGEMGLDNPAEGTFFRYTFDRNVFPYAWYFASYGGWNGLYTGVLEPATAIPYTLSTSIKNGTCSILAPGGVLSTRVTIEAGLL